MFKPIICIMGPTAAGKSDLALRLADSLPIEIINVDSAMLYREMDIGTAKPSQIDRKKIPHHLIDLLDPPETFSVAKFCEIVPELISTIQKKGHIPFLIGGTMLYFNALQRGLSSLPDKDPDLRSSISERANKLGWPILHRELKKLDPISAAQIHPHDQQRISRALEVFYLTKKPLSELHALSKNQPIKTFRNIFLIPQDRAWLHGKVAVRFDNMLEFGFLEEVKQLIKKWSLNLNHQSLRSVGYRQAFEYIQSGLDYATFRDKALAATRQLAKRQLTWLRNWHNDGQIIYCDDPDVSTKLYKVVTQILDDER